MARDGDVLKAVTGRTSGADGEIRDEVSWNQPIDGIGWSDLSKRAANLGALAAAKAAEASEAGSARQEAIDAEARKLGYRVEPREPEPDPGQRIFKHRLSVSRVVQEVLVPAVSTVLTAQWQADVGLVLWTLCSPSHSVIVRRFVVVGTGVRPPVVLDAGGYVATVQDPDGVVWHVFEVVG